MQHPQPASTRDGHEIVADHDALYEALGADRYHRLAGEINRRQWLAMGLRPAEMNDLVRQAVEEATAPQHPPRTKQRA